MSSSSPKRVNGKCAVANENISPVKLRARQHDMGKENTNARFVAAGIFRKAGESVNDDDHDEPEELCCDSCGCEIQDGELYWTDSKGSTLCEECIPPGSTPVGTRH